MTTVATTVTVGDGCHDRCHGQQYVDVRAPQAIKTTSYTKKARSFILLLNYFFYQRHTLWGWYHYFEHEYLYVSTHTQFPSMTKLQIFGFCFWSFFLWPNLWFIVVFDFRPWCETTIANTFRDHFVSTSSPQASFRQGIRVYRQNIFRIVLWSEGRMSMYLWNREWVQYSSYDNRHGEMSMVMTTVINNDGCHDNYHGKCRQANLAFLIGK